MFQRSLRKSDKYTAVFAPGVPQAAFQQYAGAAAGGEQAYSSSRATLMDDFVTAQQMHAQQEVDFYW